MPIDLPVEIGTVGDVEFDCEPEFNLGAQVGLLRLFELLVAPSPCALPVEQFVKESRSTQANRSRPSGCSSNQRTRSVRAGVGDEDSLLGGRRLVDIRAFGSSAKPSGGAPRDPLDLVLLRRMESGWVTPRVYRDRRGFGNPAHCTCRECRLGTSAATNGCLALRPPRPLGEARTDSSTRSATDSGSSCSPEPQHRPPACLQVGRSLGVAFDVSGDLVGPELRVGGGLGVVLGDSRASNSRPRTPLSGSSAVPGQRYGAVPAGDGPRP